MFCGAVISLTLDGIGVMMLTVWSELVDSFFMNRPDASLGYPLLFV